MDEEQPPEQQAPQEEPPADDAGTDRLRVLIHGEGLSSP